MKSHSYDPETRRLPSSASVAGKRPAPASKVHTDSYDPVTGRAAGVNSNYGASGQTPGKGDWDRPRTSRAKGSTPGRW
jgi:hypothetical protein